MYYVGSLLSGEEGVNDKVHVIQNRPHERKTSEQCSYDIFE